METAYSGRWADLENEMMATMTEEQIEEYYAQDHAKSVSEMRAERMNEFALEGIDMGPSDDDSYERFPEIAEGRL
jgi:hypothetical protein